MALALVLAGACGDGEAATDFAPDAATSADAGACNQDLEIGRCELVGSGTACIGLAGETTQFVALADGDEIPIVTGPQGAQMFVIAARAHGIAPGDRDAPSDADPLIEVKMHRTSYSVVARFRGRAGLAPDLDVEGAFVVSDLFVVIDAEVPIEDGQGLTARGTLKDANGVERCGELSFQATR